MMFDLNHLIWFSKRELDYAPPHFIKAHTPATYNSIFWIRSKIVGRFALILSDESINDTFLFDMQTYPYFEYSSEAMLYELRWAGSK